MLYSLQSSFLIFLAGEILIIIQQPMIKLKRKAYTAQRRIKQWSTFKPYEKGKTKFWKHFEFLYAPVL
jgi:hypothetical protein